jgi:hypothetical protein
MAFSNYLHLIYNFLSTTDVFPAYFNMTWILIVVYTVLRSILLLLLYVVQRSCIKILLLSLILLRRGQNYVRCEDNIL